MPLVSINVIFYIEKPKVQTGRGTKNTSINKSEAFLNTRYIEKCN